MWHGLSGKAGKAVPPCVTGAVAGRERLSGGNDSSFQPPFLGVVDAARHSCGLAVFVLRDCGRTFFASD